MIKKGFLVVGIAVLLLGGVFFVFGFHWMFNPSPTDVIPVNGVSEHPSNPGFKSAAEGVLVFGLLTLLVGLLISFIAIFKPQWIKTSGWSQPWAFEDNNQSSFSQNKGNEIPIQQEQVDYTNVNNLLGSLTPVDEGTTINSMNEYSKPSDDYSETFDSPSQPSDDYSESFDTSSQNFESDKTCSFCGAIVKANEQFCNNCGKRL